MAVPVETYRSIIGKRASGVSIVTTRRAGGLLGITVSSFCSLSLRPPLVLVCIDRAARSHGTIGEQGCFGINLLRHDQKELSDRAAGRHGARGAWLLGVESRTASTGAPLLRDCLAWLDCALVDRHEGGDHTIFVGRVEAAGGAGGRPLLWFGGGYHRLGPAAGRRRGGG